MTVLQHYQSRHAHRHSRRWLGLLLAMLWPLSVTAGEQTLSEAPDWQSLSYEARQLFVRGEIGISLSRLGPDAAAAALWPAADRQPLQPAAGLLRLDAQMKLLSNRARLRLWLDPADLRLYQRWRLTEGSESRLKTSRFLDDGLLWLRREPQGRDAAPEQWPAVREKHIAYPEAAAGPRWLDPTSLLLAAGSTCLRQVGDSLALPVFTDQQAYRVTLTVVGPEALDVDYQLLAGESRQPIRGERELRRIDLHYEPLVKLKDAPEFNLLGLSGDIRLYVDPQHGMPVQLQGEAESRGQLAIKLREIILRRPSAP